MNATNNGSRTAVFVRCHKFNLKLAHLFCEIDGGVGYDLFIMTDDTNGKVEYGIDNRVSFKWDALWDFRVDPSYHESVIHYGDLMLSIFARNKPDYSHYVMLDFDVHFSFLGRAWMEVFCHKLQTDGAVDMVAPQLLPSHGGWVWHAASAKRFKTPFASFFPVVALSARAIRCNESQRMSEAADTRRGEKPVFCEAFLPSALHEAGYNLVDLNVFLPESYALSSFNFTLPAPFRPDENCEIGRLVHPIKEMIDAPLPPDARARVLEVEPERNHPIKPDLAFEVAAELVRSQAARRGLFPDRQAPA